MWRRVVAVLRAEIKCAVGRRMTHYWRVRTRLPERFGQCCRVLVWARRMNSCLVEFGDGYRVVTSRHYVRRKKGEEGNGTFHGHG